MSMRHTVKRGDSLWSLSHQYQGSGTQYRKILDHHNGEVARRGPKSGLLTIKDPNLIFIGQTLFLPPRPQRVEQGKGKKFEANKLASPVDLTLKYKIGTGALHDFWVRYYGKYLIKTELSGDITIEMLSEDRHRHNLEIALGKDVVEVKSKLKKIYHPAIRELLSEPKVKFEGGKVKLNSPIDPKIKGNIGGYDIEVSRSGLNQLSGSIEPSTISGIVEAEGRKYKYSADIKFKVDVYWSNETEPVGPEPVPVAETVKKRVPSVTKNINELKPSTNPGNSVDNKIIVATVVILFMVPGLIIVFGGGCSQSFAEQDKSIRRLDDTIELGK